VASIISWLVFVSGSTLIWLVSVLLWMASSLVATSWSTFLSAYLYSWSVFLSAVIFLK
jgi:hypothetical protein